MRWLICLILGHHFVRRRYSPKTGEHRDHLVCTHCLNETSLLDVPACQWPDRPA